MIVEECYMCKGQGIINALISQHDDKKEIVSCPICCGSGTIREMDEDEENDYLENYW
jgi:hypothetical protein